MEGAEAARLLASLRLTRDLECAVCGQPFRGMGRAHYCSERCRSRAHYLYHHPDAKPRRRLRGIVE